jgi:multiple sugar transport system permease protein
VKRKREQIIPYLLLTPVHFVLLVVVGLPTLYILWLSLNTSTWGTSLQFVGLENYRQLFTDPYFWRATLNTFLVVIGVVYIEMVLGLLLATFFIKGVLAKKLMFPVILMPYAISPVVGVLIWKTLMDPNIGIVARLLSMITHSNVNYCVSPSQSLVLIGFINLWLHLPFTFILLYSGMLSISETIYEAARIDGADSFQIYFRITLPLLTQTMLITIIFRLVFAFRLFSEVWLLTGGGPIRKTEVMAVYLYQHAFRYGNFGIAAATGCLMVIGSLLIASLYLYQMQNRMSTKE